MKRLALLVTLGLLGSLSGSKAATPPAELKILFPLGREAYQTNEWIDISLIRTGPLALEPGPLVLSLAGPNASTLDFTFNVQAGAGTPPAATDHLHVNGNLLRPGHYEVRATASGTAATGHFEVYSHVRKSSFKTIDWGSRAAKHEQAVLGEDSLGFNTIWWAYGGIDVNEMIRGGLDYMRNCTMGGWHYMDLRRECDWSDPYVLGGGIARVSRQTFEDRINPNCVGEHFYDEPMLAEVEDAQDPAGKHMVRYGVPAQERSFRAAFGKDPPGYSQMHFDRPDDSRRWSNFNRWRLLLLEAAWKLSSFSVNYVEPGYLATSQNQWAWQAFDCGYYFNVNRPFPVISRHALYDYKYGGDFTPSFAYEFGRIRDLQKPNWYLPMWGCGHNELYRAEQYLSFMQNLQGIAKPPDLLVHRPSRTIPAQSIVESNKLMTRLGTIFENLPVPRSQVAVLYSMSHNLHDFPRGQADSYRGNTHYDKLLYLYIASKLLHVSFFPIVDEDVMDGSLAAHHKVVLLAGIDYLDSKVLSGLKAFMAQGGTVLLSAESKVQINGARRFDLPLEGVELNASMDRWAQDKQWDRWGETVQSNSFFKTALKMARVIEPALMAAGIKPICTCDQPGVVVSRQGQGDIDYFFAVNATPDADAFGWYFLKPVDATIGFENNGRPVYDAVRGGRMEEFQAGSRPAAAKVRFGPGQMRVFARSARPIGGVQAMTPVVSKDFTLARDPIRVDLNAALVDDQKRLLLGSAPFQIEVIDPLKSKRFDLYRATNGGLLRLSLPLAANDPAGKWTVLFRELLSNSMATTSFIYQPPQCASMAGATRRAVLFGQDRANTFRFFRTHKNLTIAKGASKFNDAAAERLARILEPWDIRCKIVPASTIKRRELTPREKPTWVDAGGAFDLREPAILLGNGDDNPLIRHIQDQKFLPYLPVRDQFPGRGRGMLAWQRDGLAYFGHESLTLIGFDEPGLSEAVGTAYEIAAGIDPLTPLSLPDSAVIRPATKTAPQPPKFASFWRLTMPDRPVAIRAFQGGVIALSEDGTLCHLDASGKKRWQKTVEGGENWSLEVTGDGTKIFVGAAHHIYGLDTQGKPLFDFSLDRDLPPDQREEGLTFAAISPDGSRILAAITGYTHARAGWQSATVLRLFDQKGKQLWSMGGLDPKTNKPIIADRARSGFFSLDGKKIVVFADKTAHLIDPATGKPGKTVEATSGAPWNENLLLADGDNILLVYSPAQDKVISRLDCAKAGPVTFSPGLDGILIGTEADGALHLVKAVNGKLIDQTTWKLAVYTGVVKHVAAVGSKVAVSCWGGNLRLIDARGKVEFEQQFSQDISCFSCREDSLVVALADGSVVGLKLQQNP